MNCTICAAPLATERDIFGPAYAPVCEACFLNTAVAICPHCNGLGLETIFNDGSKTCTFCLGKKYVNDDAILDWLDWTEHDGDCAVDHPPFHPKYWTEEDSDDRHNHDYEV